MLDALTPSEGDDSLTRSRPCRLLCALGATYACAAPTPSTDPPVGATPAGAPAWSVGDAFLVSTGNPSGGDEDPAVLQRIDGSLSVAFYSDRAGARPDGNESKEIYGVTASLGEAFGAPQRLTFDDTGWAFTPTLAEDGSGGLHLAWWRLGLLPEGCTVDVDCTGTDNRISWTRGDTAGASGDITTGPGDWLPTLVHDASRERFLLVFAAVARDADGVVDLGEARTRLFAVTGAGNPPVWSSPVPLPALDDAAYHNTYPSLAVLPATTAGGVSSFVMAFTRYDAAQPGDPLHVIVEESTDTWVSTSEDGLGWQEPWRLSSGTDAIDVFPSVFVDFEGLPNVLWVSTTASAPAGETVATADLSTTVSPMPELAGYTSRVIATRTAGVLFGAWAIGAEPNYEVEGRFFQR